MGFQLIPISITLNDYNALLYSIAIWVSLCRSERK